VQTDLSHRALLRETSLWMLAAAHSPLPTGAPLLKAGLVSDCHYADQDTAINRTYREALPRLENAVGVFRRAGVRFILQNGDLIDGQTRAEEYLRAMNDVLARSGIPSYHVFGNHDVQTLTKPQFLEIVGADAAQYSFDEGGIHFVVLDGCYRGDHVAYAAGNFDWRDATIPPSQIEWLAADLEESEKPSVVFVHQRLDLPAGNSYALASSSQVRKVLEASGRVLAVFQGHSHHDEYSCLNGIHYCTLRALVEGSGPDHNACAVLNVYQDGTLRLDGFVP
jgi:alkaline phosphatase